MSSYGPPRRPGLSAWLIGGIVLLLVVVLTTNRFSARNPDRRTGGNADLGHGRRRTGRPGQAADRCPHRTEDGVLGSFYGQRRRSASARSCPPTPLDHPRAVASCPTTTPRPVSLSVRPSVCRFARQSVGSPVRLSVRPSVCRFARPSVRRWSGDADHDGAGQCQGLAGGRGGCGSSGDRIVRCPAGVGVTGVRRVVLLRDLCRPLPVDRSRALQ